MVNEDMPNRDGRAISLGDGRLLAAVFAHSPQGMVLIDEAFTILAVNPSFARQVHREADELMGADAHVVLKPWFDYMQPIYRKILKNGRSYHNAEFSVQERRGKVSYWDITVSPVLDPKGQVRSFLHVQSDVTQRIRTQKMKELSFEQLLAAHEQLASSKEVSLMKQHSRESMLLQWDTQIGLKRRHELSDLIFENAIPNLAYLDAEFNYVMVNLAHARDLGWKAEEMVGKNYFDLFPCPEHEAIFQRVVSTGEPIRFVSENPYYVGDMNGEKTYWSWTLAPTKERGRVTGLIFSLLNITKEIAHRKALEHALLQVEKANNQSISAMRIAQQHAAELDAIIRSMNEPIIIFSTTGNVVRSNSASVDLFGWDPTGLSYAEFIERSALRNKDGKPVNWDNVLNYPYKKVVEREKYYFKTSEGEERTVLASAAPIMIKKEFLGVVIFLYDITEMGRLNQQLSEKNRHLQTIINQIPAGVVICDESGNVSMMNERSFKTYRQLFGQGNILKDEYNGAKRYRFNGENCSLSELPLACSLRSGLVFEGAEIVLQESGGIKRHIVCNTTPLRDDDGRIKGAVGIFRDETHAKEAEKERESFIYNVSHDMRSPLSIILCQAQILEMSAVKDTLRNSAKMIITAAQRVNAMIMDLVESASLDSGQIQLRLELINLYNFTTDLLERMKDVLEVERIDVNSMVDLPLVTADPSRLERILVNLLSNALKYSDKDQRVKVIFSERDTMIFVTVQDFGVGILKEESAYIFKRYYRAPAARYRQEGLGLGLYITKGLVEAHGGQIWVESEPGVGSKFIFTLPIISIA